MRPIHLSVEGLACFKETQEIDFSGLDLFAISGPTGAGKSTVLDAILFALYGEVPRVGKQDLKEMISAARERVSVRFDFAVGERRYRIARTLRRRGSATVRLEEHDGTDFNKVLADQVRTASVEVTRLLGLDVDAFTQAVILPQGEFARFLKADPRKRREMLRTLLRLDVYERMRQAAQDTSTRKKHELEQLDTRLREDYNGVSDEALATLQLESKQAGKHLAERRKESGEAETRLITIRERHEKTVDLTKNEARLAELRLNAPMIDEARTELETARRAAELVPLIKEADRATRDANDASNKADSAKQASAAAVQEHAERQRDLAQAEEQTQQEAPALRDRVTQLDRILGRLPELRRLATEVAKKRTGIGQLEQEIEEGRKCLEQFGEEAARQQASVETSRTELDTIDYDAELDDALDRVRETVTKLDIARGKLQEAKPAREQRRTTLDGLTADVDRLKAQVRERAEVQEKVQHDLEQSEEALHAAHRLDAASHLREALVPGAPCPVCTQLVTDPPTADLHPDVVAARSAHEEAACALRRVRADAQGTRDELTKAESDARAAHEALVEADHRVRAALTEIRELEMDIRTDLGCRAPADEEAIEAWCSREVQTVSAARRLYNETTERFETAVSELSALRQNEETKRSELDRIQRERRKHAEDLRAEEKSLDSVRSEIAEVTQSDDPEGEGDCLTSRIVEIESLRTSAVSAEAEARSTVAATRQAREERERAASEAEVKLAERIELRDRRLSLALFDTAEDVQTAVRDDTAQIRLRTLIADHERDLHAVDQRVRDLRNDLGGERVSADQLEGAQATARGIGKKVEELVRQTESLRQQVETMTDRLGKAETLREQLRASRTDHRLFSSLATDLRSDKFQAYVLEDSFTKLAQGASGRLFTLSGQRYSLTFQEDQILVVDHDNADETRISDTLSGGETFLASLSLALELSRQVQEAAGAVNLDSLFIDEGFGTLDPDTLATVSETIQSLQVAGRMVGVITHIPELRDEFSQQIHVSKHQGYSTVQVRGTL